jgi:glutamyl-tRNA reductase
LESPQINLLVTGLNHKTELRIREKISFHPEQFDAAFERLKEVPEIREAVILSTCNRTEIYAIMNTLPKTQPIVSYLSDFHQIPPDFFLYHLYTKEGMNAARHLFRVTAGLDSLVLGENQILGQVKQSYKIGQTHQSLGTTLHRLFQRAIEAGKKIRNETMVGENPGSIGEAAVELAKQIFEDLQERAILVIGAGEIGEIVLEALMESGVSQIMVANRTYQKAQELAQRLNGTAFPLEALAHPLVKSDIVITATGSSTPILKKNDLEEIMKQRRHSPLFIIDIAVPRDVEENASKIENLFLYNIDDLKHIVEESNQAFQKEIMKANMIIEEELQEFYTWHQSRQIVPTIKALTEKTKKIKEQELQKFVNRLPNLSEKEKAVLEQFTDTLIAKILHEPLIQLKALAHHPLGEEYLEITRHLFKLDDDHQKGNEK